MQAKSITPSFLFYLLRVYLVFLFTSKIIINKGLINFLPIKLLLAETIKFLFASL